MLITFYYWPKKTVLVVSLKNYMRFIRTQNFTIERFDDDKVYFLDILIDKTKTDLYYKPTHAGQKP